MPRIHSRRGLAAVIVVAASAVAVPAAAQAATVTVTGDDGNPVAIAAGAPPTIRNMRPDVGVAFPPGEGRYRLTVTNAAGAAASTGVDCFSQASLFPSSVNYAGNGAYTVTVTNYAATDRTCATPLSSESYAFTIAASTSLAPPAGPFLLRSAGSFSTNVLTVGVGQNPGASSHEVRFAANATLGPDGGIAGNSGRASVDSATGTAQLRFPGPGVYTVVARATRFTSAGEVGSPWSPPATVVVSAPFDVQGGANGLQFRDSRGPSYSVRLQLREKSTRGRVSVSLARGTKGGRYRSLGSAKISRIGTISKRLTVTRPGTYRLRFSYAGSKTIAKGRQTFVIKVRRIISFG